MGTRRRLESLGEDKDSGRVKYCEKKKREFI